MGLIRHIRLQLHLRLEVRFLFLPISLWLQGEAAGVFKRAAEAAQVAIVNLLLKP
jgi:hypothetical protein